MKEKAKKDIKNIKRNNKKDAQERFVATGKGITVELPNKADKKGNK